jgi:acyl-[acyl-carrier-protein]-phospholipid O-acyltransferase/long-chain-fatty-acid--[acyl-carrier-protein] ligase
MHYRAGSVGRLMPKIEYYIRPIHNRPLAEFASAEEFKETTELRTVAYSNVGEEQSTGSTNKLPAEVEFQKRSNRSIGIEGIGQLFIKGPNIMLGYMHSNNPGMIHPTSSEELGLGWYDTGDIVKIDEDGYLTLLGRIQQFVTIEEVMSLILIEDLANMIDVDSKHVAICPDDDNKDKQIFLLTTSQTINSEKFIEIMHKNSIDSNQKNIPVIIPVKEIPILPIGKVNYRQITKMLENYRKVTKMLK